MVRRDRVGEQAVTGEEGQWERGDRNVESAQQPPVRSVVCSDRDLGEESIRSTATRHVTDDAVASQSGGKRSSRQSGSRRRS